MSEFKTSIPTELAAFVKALPPHSTIKTIKAELTTTDFGGKMRIKPDAELVIVWENPAWESGRTNPVDYPLDLIVRNKGPKTAVKASEVKKPTIHLRVPQEPVAPETAPVIPRQVNMSEAELKEALARGAQIEFQGIDPRWQVFVKGQHTWTEGFFYREQKVRVDTGEVAA